MMRCQPDDGVASDPFCAGHGMPWEFDTEYSSTGPSLRSCIGPCAYATPKVESAVMDGSLPPDVVAEWSGEAVDVPEEGTPTGSVNPQSRTGVGPEPTVTRTHAHGTAAPPRHPGSLLNKRWHGHPARVLLGWKPMPRRGTCFLQQAASRRPDVAEYPIDNEALLYDDALQTVSHLNKTAFHVWRHCDGRSIEQLAFAVTGAFDVELKTAAREVRKVVEIFPAGGLFDEEISNAAIA